MKKIKFHEGMSNCDWLMFIYIFKWAHLWVAPLWVFIGMWTIVAIEIIYKSLREAVKEIEDNL